MVLIMEQQNQLTNLHKLYRMVQQLKIEELSQEETRLLLNNLQEEIITQEKKILKMEESFQIQMNHLKTEIDRLSHL